KVQHYLIILFILFTIHSKMSCCGGNCGCGAGCKCGNGCGGCGMYPDVEKNTTATIIDGVAPTKTFSQGSEMSFVTEGGHACKCGSNCTCDPCNC
ncbi:hypothetical protein FKQ75_29920, partial [Klebsiella pneumoniae]